MRKLFVIALLLGGCAGALPADEAKMWVERLGPACESAGSEEWTAGWIECIRRNYAAQAPDGLQSARDSIESPAYTRTYCTTVQGDKYSCITF